MTQEPSAFMTALRDIFAELKAAKWRDNEPDSLHRIADALELMAVLQFHEISQRTQKETL